MPIAPIITPGSSLAASATVIRQGTLVVNLYTPALIQVNELVDQSIVDVPPPFDIYAEGDTNAATISSSNMPTVLMQFQVIPGYYDPEVGPIEPLNCIAAQPLIVSNYFGWGNALGQPIHLYPGVSSYFSVRAPLEKIGFRLYCSGYQTSPLFLPSAPDALFGMPGTSFTLWPLPPTSPWEVSPGALALAKSTYTAIQYTISVSQ